MRRSIPSLVLALLLALVLAVIGAVNAAPASAETDLRFAPPGANDWSCKPTAAHPRPVVLIHGAAFNMMINWFHLSPLLKQRGYCVFALTYGIDPLLAELGLPAPGGMIPTEQSAEELKVFVDRVLAATGARQVDFIGHSEGTFMPQYYLKFLGGAPKVKRYVAYAPLYDGTTFYGLPALLTALQSTGISSLGLALASTGCAACPDWFHDSAMQQKLTAGGAAVPGIEYTTVMSKYDEAVQPYTSGYLPGQHNFVLQDLCPLDLSEHGGPAVDPVADQITFNALDPAHAKPIDCGLFG